MARVSVIIPTYNRGAFLEETVSSVLAQTFTDWELLVVDDGSTDDTESVLAPYADALRYIRIPHSGVSAARNVGLQETQGEWVAFLDSDDLWLPKKLERQIRALQRSPEIPLSYTDEIWIRNGRRVNPRARHQKYSGWIFERCLPLCIISPSSALIRRDLFEEVGEFDETLPACEDYDLWLRITLRYPALLVEEKLIIKRGGHPDQLSKAHWGMDRFRIRALRKVLQGPHLRSHHKEAVLKVLRHKCHIIAQGARKRGKQGLAKYYEELANHPYREVHDIEEVLENTPEGRRLEG